MNVRYFLLTIALIPSIAYTAEITPKKEDRTLKHQRSASNHRDNSLKTKESSSKQLKKHPKKESQAVLLDKPKPSLPKELSLDSPKPKDTAPVATYIASLTQPITFNGRTQSLYEWLKNSEKNNFGPTRVVETHIQSTKQTFIERGNVNLVNDPGKFKNMLAEQNGIYISNIEEKKSIKYGAIVLQEHLNYRASTVPEKITTTINHFLLWFIDQQSKKSKKVDDKKKDKKKEELQSAKAEKLAETIEELKSIDQK